MVLLGEFDKSGSNIGLVCVSTDSQYVIVRPRVRVKLIELQSGAKVICRLIWSWTAY